MTHLAKTRFHPAVFKNLLLDLEDRLRAEASKAFAMIRDHAGLDTKRARELEGQARFRMMEKAFQETCELHGGRLLENGVIGVAERKIFQPFMRFEHNGQGFIVGLAAMSEPKKLPVKNKSRIAAVSLNYFLSPRFDFDGAGAKIGDIFISLLVCRDRARAGHIEEVAVGVIDAAYEAFLFYESLETYLSGHADIDEPEIDPARAVGDVMRRGAVRLKTGVEAFTPPEAVAVTQKQDG